MFQKIILFFMCLFGTCQTPDTVQKDTLMPATEITISEDGRVTFYNVNSMSGSYLASRFAQDNHDWKKSGQFLNMVMQFDPSDPDVKNKAMILAMGAGQPERAIKLAKDIVNEDDKTNALAYIILAADEFKNEKYEDAQGHIDIMPSGSISDFIIPILDSWAKAAQGEYQVSNLTANTIHIQHAFLIGQYLNKTEDFEKFARYALGAQGLSVRDLERVADALTLVDKHDDAIELYKRAYESWPENEKVEGKLRTLEEGRTPSFFTPVTTPSEGFAQALFDMTQLLFNEKADDSARVFGQMALYLNPDLSDAHILLGYVATRNERYKDAIAHYEYIPKNDENYGKSRRLIADLHEEKGEIEPAVHALQILYSEEKDIESLVQIGDIYRRAEKFDSAVKTYNQAIKALGSEVPPNLWHIYYVRGMCYERLGDWEKAEADLIKALEFKPDHPLVLNYLGYAWADRGENLEQALNMIKRAVEAAPQDGYITDSLGWVFYRMGNYEDAVTHLERAVELMPYDPIINDHLGDAYWEIGRKSEARFQWERAKNYADSVEDAKLIDAVTRKLSEGLTQELKEISKTYD